MGAHVSRLIRFPEMLKIDCARLEGSVWGSEWPRGSQHTVGYQAGQGPIGKEKKIKKNK